VAILPNLKEGMTLIISPILQNTFKRFIKAMDKSFSNSCIVFCSVSIEQPLAPFYFHPKQ